VWWNEETHIVKIPAHLVESALDSIPKTFRACGRNPKNDWICEGNRPGFVNFGEAVQMIDPYTKEVRKATRKDVDDVTKICDYMDQVVVFERAIAPSEVRSGCGSSAHRRFFYNNCTKHAYIGMNRPENMRAAAKMGYVVAGGEDKFRQRPLFSQSTDPVSPLVHSKGATDTLLEAIRCGVPAKINSMGLAGGTTCVNLAATLVTENAEKLSMFVLGQLVQKDIIFLLQAKLVLGGSQQCKTFLQEVPGYSQVLYDYCYVNNFDNADKPILIKLAKGEGRKFAKMMKDAISYLRRSLPRIFEEEEYQMLGEN